MSAIWANERDLSGRVGTSERGHDRQFLVLVEENDGPADALSAPGIPAIGEAHPDDSGAICTSLRYSLPEAPFSRLYQIDAEYTTQTPEDGGGLGQDSDTPPDERDHQFETLPYAVQLLATYDAQGEPLVSSAGQLLPAEDRTIERHYLMIRYTRWYSAANFDPLTAPADWVDRVNDQTWLGIDAFQARITSVRARREFWQGQLFYEVEFEILVKPVDLGDWSVEITDRGTNKLDGGDIVTITRADSSNPDIVRPVTEPQLLDGAGDELNPLDDPVMLTFVFYPPLDFAGIGLQ